MIQTLPHDHHLRAYAWALQSPLLVKSPVALPAALMDHMYIDAHLKNLHQNPQALLDHVASQNRHTIGTRFEQYWQFYLMQHPYVKHAWFNVPLRADQSQTLGELDVVCELVDGQVYHFELVVKFYLANGDARDPLQWIGPNLRDTLSRKYHHMLTHQLPLPIKAYEQGIWPTAFTALPSPQEWTHASLWKGYGFWPLQDYSTQALFMAPSIMHKACLHGWWLSLQEIDRLAQVFPAQCFALLPKREWLAPAEFSKDSPFLLQGLSALRQAIFDASLLDNGYAMVAVLQQSESIWIEASRGFLTTNVKND